MRKLHCEKWKDNNLSAIISSDEYYFHLFHNTPNSWTKEKHLYVEKIYPNLALMLWGSISSGKIKVENLRIWP